VFLSNRSVAKISAQNVRVVIAPRSHAIPTSGKVVLAVQSRTRQNEGEATSQGLILDHPAPGRQIEPHQVIRKQISVKVDAKPGDVVELSCEFPGQKAKLKCNAVVLRRK
jgi:hypothetical protein